jgi:hypothetical protein
MNEPTRSRLFDALAELGHVYPDWRFGQLISNVAGWADRELWDINDDELLAAATEHRQRQAEQKQEARS